MHDKEAEGCSLARVARNVQSAAMSAHQLAVITRRHSMEEHVGMQAVGWCKWQDRVARSPGVESFAHHREYAHASCQFALAEQLIAMLQVIWF